MIDVRFQPMQQRSPWNEEAWGKWLRKSPFKSRTPMDELERELRHIEATDIVIESGHDRLQIRNDGWPRGGSAPAHPDVRLHFRCKHGTLMYECQVFDTWQANLRAIGLWMQRQRLAIEEWGIGSGGEVYRGFAALPAGASSIAGAEWASLAEARRFLQQVAGGNTVGTDDGLYKEAARKAHPDTGGSNDLMARVNRARDFILGRLS